ncbi:MAG: hypothetical protein COA73_10215 [Candidatus Hydrogenedentota bacterium]|nr:MAG: hypothetical protein COA73_10215 [Candidatus Hydrogenedentota bacterium]
MLCIDEVTEQNPRWELLSHSDHGRCYKFTPKPNAPSWFVRWGYNYSWNHFRQAILGQDEATNDWRNTGHAERHYIPVIHYRLLGTPRLLTGSLDTLLVTEYRQSTRTLKDFFSDPNVNPMNREEVLIKLGELLGHIHTEGMAHGHFELENVLIQYDDATRLIITDWYDMKLVAPEDLLKLKRDVRSLLHSMHEIDLTDERLSSFMDSYSRKRPWLKEAQSDLLSSLHQPN